VFYSDWKRVRSKNWARGPEWTCTRRFRSISRCRYAKTTHKNKKLQIFLSWRLLLEVGCAARRNGKIFNAIYSIQFLFNCNSYLQGCGSGLDPDSIGSVDSDPDSGSGSGSKRAKITQKSRKKFVKSSCFEVLDGLFRELKASSGTWTWIGKGLGIGKLQFLIKKKFNVFFQL
jgi:hypothetical protein